MKLLYITLGTLLMAAISLRAQDIPGHVHGPECEHGHEVADTRKHAGHGHHQDRNEIGISFGALYGLDDKQWGTGIHVHYFRTLGEHSRWSAGAFVEQAWIDHTHFSAGAGVRFEPVERLSLGVFPGITTAKYTDEHPGHSHEGGWRTRFSMHFEVVCDLFYWKHFHLGPAIDYSWSKNDSHFMLGLHGAFCF